MMGRRTVINFQGNPTAADLRAIGQGVQAKRLKHGDTVRRATPAEVKCQLDEGSAQNVGEALFQRGRVRRDGRNAVKKQKATDKRELDRLREKYAECIARAQRQVELARGRVSKAKAKAVFKGGVRRWEKAHEAAERVAYNLEAIEPGLGIVWEPRKFQRRWYRSDRTSPTEFFLDWVHDNRTEVDYEIAQAFAKSDAEYAAEQAAHYGEAPF